MVVRVVLVKSVSQVSFEDRLLVLLPSIDVDKKQALEHCASRSAIEPRWMVDNSHTFLCERNEQREEGRKRLPVELVPAEEEWLQMFSHMPARRVRSTQIHANPLFS